MGNIKSKIRSKRKSKRLLQSEEGATKIDPYCVKNLEFSILSLLLNGQKTIKKITELKKHFVLYQDYKITQSISKVSKRKMAIQKMHCLKSNLFYTIVRNLVHRSKHARMIISSEMTAENAQSSLSVLDRSLRKVLSLPMDILDQKYLKVANFGELTWIYRFDADGDISAADLKKTAEINNLSISKSRLRNPKGSSSQMVLGQARTERDESRVIDTSLNITSRSLRDVDKNFTILFLRTTKKVLVRTKFKKNELKIHEKKHKKAKNFFKSFVKNCIQFAPGLTKSRNFQVIEDLYIDNKQHLNFSNLQKDYSDFLHFSTLSFLSPLQSRSKPLTITRSFTNKHKKLLKKYMRKQDSKMRWSYIQAQCYKSFFTGRWTLFVGVVILQGPSGWKVSILLFQPRVRTFSGFSLNCVNVFSDKRLGFVMSRQFKPVKRKFFILLKGGVMLRTRSQGMQNFVYFMDGGRERLLFVDELKADQKMVSFDRSREVVGMLILEMNQLFKYIYKV